MTRSLRFVLLTGIVALSLITASVALGDTISATCTWGGQSQACASNTWYPSSVTVVWTTDSPPDSTSGCELGIAYHYNTDGVDDVSCSADWGGTGDNRSYALHVETSSPVVSIGSSSSPNDNGWYNHPVTFAFTGSSFSQGVTCTPPTTFAGPDEINAVVTGSCTDAAGKTTTKSVILNYDATPPIITGALPSRSPDFNGWYNHPVSFTFTGTDAVSGIQSCQTVTYSGPDSDRASLVGRCQDRAGNVTTLAVPLHYDATPPSVHVSATTGDQIVRLNWQTSADLSSLTISRSPGVHGSSDSVVDRGGDGIFNDTRVTNGVRYTYTIRARDQAGNVTVRRLKAMPGVRLLSPVNGARMTSPPLLVWTAVRHATYYNVQVYRAGRRVLSTWPGRATLALGQSWIFGGHRFHLRPGRYRWYVWPGYGSRRFARYGNLIGAGTFVVTRAS